ncbi:MAG: transcriptional regulator [Bacteroidetes bacterium]|nr:transcriptional regulator [Bacteroidota bacterium]
MNGNPLKIAIVEPSVIVRSGLTAVLKRIPGYRIQPVEILTIDSMNHYLNIHKPDVLIINPSFWGYFDIAKIKNESTNTRIICIALIYSVIDEHLLRDYDERISIYDSVDQLREKFDKLFSSPSAENTEEPNTLSTREKEIIACVVRGMTNKEIAQSLYLSAHTVITHRRNIARKLEIHSTAGLTIYAIMNKLVELDDIKQS